MEKTEKHKFNMKPNVEEENHHHNHDNNNKLKGKRHSKMANNLPPTSNYVINQGIQGAAPVVQPQFYQMQQNGVPVMINSGLPTNAYISNQVVPPGAIGVVNIPTSGLCPYCGAHYRTKIQESFNCCTCFAYFMIIILIPILLILAAYSGCNSANCNNGCDCNCRCCVCGTCECNCCTDYDYYCDHCGQRLHSKNSCVELCPCFQSCAC